MEACGPGYCVISACVVVGSGMLSAATTVTVWNTAVGMKVGVASADDAPKLVGSFTVVVAIVPSMVRKSVFG
jgi:hypothetical protein